VELGFELRASQLQNRHIIPTAMTRVHFALVILEIGDLIKYFPGLASNHDPISAPQVARITGMSHWCPAIKAEVLIFLKVALSRSQVPVAHTCNPNYSGGRDQEDHGSNPDQANTYHKNRADGVAQGESPEFKLQY
jgi:hypothetical protein